MGKKAEGKAIVRRMQVPLLPAWALTIHKAQGMSLGKVILHVDKIFTEGQLYTGLTRVSHFTDLRVRGDIGSKVHLCAQDVLTWDEQVPIWHEVDNGPTAPEPVIPMHVTGAG